MTVRGTLGLLGVFAALALYLVVVAPPRRAPLDDPLLPLPPDRVTRLEVTWPDRALRATRTDGAWRTAGGATLPVDVVGDLLAALATIRPMDTLRFDGAPETEYGFGPPAASLVAFVGDTPAVALEVGNRNPAWTGLYVRHPGATEVLLAGALLHWELEKLHTVTPP